jgi:predicted dehydrogenase
MSIGTEQEGHLIDMVPQLPEGNAWEMAWTRQHELFARAVHDRTPPVATGEQGRYVQNVLEAIYRSSFEGREVEIRA